MMEAEDFSDKSPYLYRVMQGHIPKHSNVNFYVRSSFALIQIRSYLPATLNSVKIQKTVLVLPIIKNFRWGKLLYDIPFIISSLNTGTCKQSVMVPSNTTITDCFSVQNKAGCSLQNSVT